MDKELSLATRKLMVRMELANRCRLYLEAWDNTSVDDQIVADLAAVAQVAVAVDQQGS